MVASSTACANAPGATIESGDLIDVVDTDLEHPTRRSDRQRCLCQQVEVARMFGQPGRALQTSARRLRLALTGMGDTIVDEP